MAVQFKSEQRRAFWGGLAFSLVTEYALVFCILRLFGQELAPSFGLSLLAVVGIQLFLGAYALLALARRTIWYFWIERDSRAQGLAAEFNRLNFPRPDGFYTDADQYLEQVALSPATSPEGAMMASVLIGMLNSQRMYGPRMEAIFLALSIERAMKLMLPWDARAELGQ